MSEGSRIAALAAPLGCLLIAGCVTTFDPVPSPDFVAAIHFPAATSLVEARLVLHETRLHFETERKLDGTLADKPSFEQIPGEIESYRVGYADEDAAGKHVLQYATGSFVVGGIRYPAARGARLFVFRERKGSFSFGIDSKTFVVQRPANESWKPAILFREVLEKTEFPADPPASDKLGRKRRVERTRTVTHLLRWELQAGPHKIVIVPGDPIVRIDQTRVNLPADGIATIEGRGRVTVRN